MESIKLNRNNLKKITGPVKVPSYSSAGLSPSIVHIGLGNFHRSHQAVYQDELLNRNLDKSGIFAVNLIPDSFPLGPIMEKQDNLYTLITKPPFAEAEIRIIGSIMGYLNISQSEAAKEAALARIAYEKTSIVSLTVTEGGYYFNKETFEPNPNEAAVQRDMENPQDPKTAAGFLAAALERRFRENRKALTVVCCDNVPQNGKVLQSSVMFFCREHRREILPWLEDNVSFPSSMVDRITPATTQALIEELETKYGISDEHPVCGEDFRQWVLEDNFKTQVPDYAACGVQLVKEVEPYELMKMRLLNGSHSALAYAGYLLGCRFVDEGITNPLLGNFIRNHYMEEVTPTLEPVPGINIKAYKDTLVSRFSNKNISDTILRLASQGTSKIPGFILNPLADTVRRQLPHSAMIFALASWARFLSGRDEQGKGILIEDENSPAICAAAGSAQRDPGTFLVTAGLKGLSETQFLSVAGDFKKQLDMIYQKGVKSSLEEFLRV
ncbi:MAG: mannitol dehydrogenase family protein [Treponema sp.]|jgi:mannitol 2-dehydrogenase|nr:mannitol dehydrogenase family protein [Treponema sp.]